MDALQAWAVTLCVLAVAVAALRLLAPKTGTGKLLRLLIGVVFLCAAVTPLLSLRGLAQLKIAPQTEENTGVALQERLRQQVENQANTRLAEVADDMLAVYHVSVQKIEAQASILEDGGIYITSVVVTLDKQQARNESTIRQVLRERLGQEVEVVII